MRIVVAAFGNVLRSDDGFGFAVLERLAAGPVPEGVELFEAGIGGIHLVQTLLAEPADAMIVLDAVELEREPGTVMVIRPDVEDARDLSAAERREQLADMHYATPDRAMMLARSMDVLPAETLVVGCEPVDARTPSQELSGPVAGAIDTAVSEVRRVVTELGVDWS